MSKLLSIDRHDVQHAWTIYLFIYVFIYFIYLYRGVYAYKCLDCVGHNCVLQEKSITSCFVYV